MAKILVVDDSLVDRTLVAGLLSKRPGLTAVEKATGLMLVVASTGREALASIAQDMPDLVVTDLQMPEMNGLELVQAVKSQYPSLPVILMTAKGSEDIALLALQQGAAGYVPKRNLARDLLETVEGVLTAAAAERDEGRVLAYLTTTASTFALDNDASLITPLVRSLEGPLKSLKLCDANSLLRTAVCLREALLNALYHGNLEVAVELRDADEKAYTRLVQERRQQEPYRSRRIHVQATFTPQQASYTIRDEGPGFNVAALPDPKDSTLLEQTDQRGLFLIHTFMDQVTHNASGNEITMRRSSGKSAS
jgi:CheY-like chemotaxis protein